MEMHWILMGDIVNSRREEGNELALQFKQLIDYLNHAHATDILSPLTITLGDEFQGVVKDKKSGIEIILAADRYMLAHHETLHMRFVLNRGAIDTPINRAIAHGMLGSGLSTTRERIAQLKKMKKRYWIGQEGVEDAEMNDLFFLYESFISDWQGSDRKVAALFLALGDYKKVAQALKKSPSQMWKREKSLKIKPFLTISRIIKNLA